MSLCFWIFWRLFWLQKLTNFLNLSAQDPNISETFWKLDRLCCFYDGTNEMAEFTIFKHESHPQTICLSQKKYWEKMLSKRGGDLNETFLFFEICSATDGFRVFFVLLFCYAYSILAHNFYSSLNCLIKWQKSYISYIPSPDV